MSEDITPLRYFVDAYGRLIGAIGPGCEPLSEHEVPAPEDGRQMWQFPGWAWPAEKVLQDLRDECDRRLAVLKQDYPDSEVLSWDKQEAEARAGGGPLVAALALARGIDEAELIRRILQKAEAFAILSGTIIGQRQALEDRVRAGEVEVVWPAD